MIDSAVFTNSQTGATFTLNDLLMPINEFTTEVDVRLTEREKSERHGIWPGSEFLGKRLFHFTGDIFSADSTAYITKRRSVLKALMPKSHLGQKTVGRLDLQFTGQSELWSSDVVLDGYPEIPMQGLSPARSPYQLNFKAYDPRLYGPVNTITFNNLLDGVQQTATPNNAGDIETYSTVKLFGQAGTPGANPSMDMQLWNAALTQRLGNVTWKSYYHGVGHYTLIDFDKRTAFDDLGNDEYGLIGGTASGTSPAAPLQWWVLEPGTNGILFKTHNFGITRVDFTWKNAYMI